MSYVYINIYTSVLHIGTYIHIDISICIQDVLPYMCVDFLCVCPYVSMNVFFEQY